MKNNDRRKELYFEDLVLRPELPPPGVTRDGIRGPVVLDQYGDPEEGDPDEYRDEEWVQVGIEMQFATRYNADRCAALGAVKFDSCNARSQHDRMTIQLLTAQDRAPGDLTVEKWQNIVDAFEERCAYCGQPSNVCLEHVVPVWAGGRTDFNNVLPACKHCNSCKGIRSLRDWKPNQTRWWEAFVERYMEAFARIEG